MLAQALFRAETS